MLADAQQRQAAVKANLLGGVSGKNNGPTDQDLADLGITGEQYHALNNAIGKTNSSISMPSANMQFGAASKAQFIDPTQALVQQDPTQLITNSTTATPEQYQKMAAIQKLLGDKTPQGNAINPLNASQAGTYNPSQLNQFDYQGILDYINQQGQSARDAAQAETNQVAGAAQAQHDASKHGGILNSVKNAVSHPLTLGATLMNPATWAANATRVVRGQNINPTDISLPGAKVIAPAGGAVVGGIYGGPMGALAGASAGQAVGGTLENLGGQANKPYAFGGEIGHYLDKHKEDK